MWSPRWRGWTTTASCRRQMITRCGCGRRPRGHVCTSLRGIQLAVVAVARLDDDRFLSASDDHTLRLWQAATGACLHVFKGHTDAVMTVAVLKRPHILPLK